MTELDQDHLLFREMREWARERIAFHQRLLPAEGRPGSMSSVLATRLARKDVALMEAEDSRMYQRVHTEGGDFASNFLIVNLARALAVAAELGMGDNDVEQALSVVLGRMRG